MEQQFYVIGNPDHMLGFMVVSDDDPTASTDVAAVLSDLGHQRAMHGNHLRLYKLIPVDEPVADVAEVQEYNSENGIDDFNYALIQEYLK